MILLPAIDLFDKKAVRLYKGDYENMTVYSDNPIEIARDFEACGAKYIHMVDLEGAKDGTTPNIAIVEQVAKDNVMGCQFHPEKSGDVGLNILRAFCEEESK